MARYVIGIDQGTTLTKAVVFDHDARIVSSASVEVQRFRPRPGWVEQDPDEILAAAIKAAGEAVKNGRISLDDVDAVGISNQLLTTIFWNKRSGKAVGRAIVWQDTRTLPICERLGEKDQAGIERRSGSHILTNSSATRIRWLIENDKEVQKGLAQGDLLFGTVDTWLVWKLSGGAVQVTDLSNICLSLLFNTESLTYDDWMLNELGIPYEILPELRSSSEIYAYTNPGVFLGARLPIAGICGDQFAAGFGQGCHNPGDMMCNLGTGSSVTLNMGERRVSPANGIDSPILWSLNGVTTRGLGSWTNVSGSAVQWLRDGLGIINDYSEAEVFASRVNDTQGVYFVPAFSGLGGPHDDPYARGSFFGITETTTKNHMVRATFEAMAFQVRDAVEQTKLVSGMGVGLLHSGGGAARNDFLLQFLSDILGIPVIRPSVVESSVMGAAFLAGLGTGYWESQEELETLIRTEREYHPTITVDRRDELYAGWKKAIARSAGWSRA